MPAVNPGRVARLLKEEPFNITAAVISKPTEEITKLHRVAAGNVESRLLAVNIIAERCASLVATAKFWLSATSSKEVSSVIIASNTANSIISPLAILMAFLFVPLSIR